jgi:serine/threonine protein kinase
MSDAGHPTQLWRDALSHLDRVLEGAEADRARTLAELADRNPTVHALVVSLLDAQRQAENSDFLEPQRDQPAPLAPGSMLGAWRLVELIGTGGMGEVWLARRADGLYEGEVAIKTLHPWLARGAMRARFLREAQLLGRVSHPHIARLIDAGAAERGLYLVIEHIRGRPLDVYCDEQELSVQQRLRMFLDVCAAVSHAHSHLIVHRDLKPSNILVNEQGQVKLLDFGIATLLESETSRTDLTRLTGRAFTPEFAAPEQLRGETITTATDVFSLGVILFHLLAGRLPYARADNAAALEHAVLHEDSPRVSRAIAASNEADTLAARRGSSPARLQRELAGDLDNIIARALEKEPARRYPSVSELAADIDRHLRHVPVRARAATSGYRLAKFLRRNRLAASVSALALTAIFSGAGVAWWQARVARTEAGKAVAIRDFLVGVFERNSVAHPDGASARRTTAEELLAQSAAEIRTRLRDQPEVRAELLGVMARLYASLDLQKEALPLIEERLVQARALHGARSLEVARVLSDLAYSQVQIGDYAAAKRSAGESRDLFIELDDDSSLEHALALGSLAQAAYRTGEPGAEYIRENYAAALALIERHHPRNQWRIEMMMGLQRAANLMGRLDEALAICDRALALIDRHEVDSDGMVHGAVLQIRGNALSWLARHDEAERSMREAIVQYDRAGGRDHSFSADGRRELGDMLMWSGRRAEAVELLAEALATIERVKGPDDPELTAHVRTNYASALFLRGQLAAAEPHMVKALASWRDSAAALPGAQLNLARLRTLQGRFDEATQVLQGVEADIERIFGKHSWMHGTVLNRQGELALARGRFDEARAHFSQLWSEWKEPADNVTTHPVAGGVGLVKLALAAGDAAAAEKLAREVIATIERSRSRRDMPDEEAAAHLALARAQLALGQFAEARAEATRAVESRERMDAPESLWLADARLVLAESLWRMGDRTGARKLVALARQAHAAQPAIGPQYTRPLRLLESMTR